MRAIALFGKYIQENDNSFFMELLSLLEKYNFDLFFHKTFIETHTASLVKKDYKLFEKLEDIPVKVEALLSLGGDGTLLDAISLIGNTGTPLMGINLGHLGFLAATNKDELEFAVESLYNNKYAIDKRSLLHLEVNGNPFENKCYAMNDVVFFKHDKNLMTPVDVFVDGHFLNRYYGDGVIIATSTGSTAYNLSSGGPILLPDSENFIITPIASHTLTVRPVIIPDKCVITVKAGFDNKSFNISLDSNVATFEQEQTFTISKEKFYINTIRLTGHHFFDTLRKKLMWGH